MIIIDNIINNAKLFIYTGSIMAIINILLIIAFITVLCYYIKYYHMTNSICIESTDIIMKMKKRVTNLDVYRSTILFNFDMSASNSFSHWFIIATLEDNSQIALSSSRMSTIHVLFAKPFMNKLYKLKCLSKNTVDIPLTLDELLNFEHKLIAHTIYDIINFNCQDVVYYTVRHYCKTKLHKPLHGLKLCRAVCNELSGAI